ncbi:MAG: DUF4301 family protein [Bacteroidales bacterium]|nr:DUF4301 family protein [Bacteroidales bacterium]
MSALTNKDKQQLESLNISTDQVERQINQFKTGFPYSDLVAPATIGNGIIKFNDTEVQELIKQFEEDKEYYDILKFIPASGAASRMFKNIYSFVEEYKGKEIPEDFLEKENVKFDSIENFFLSISDFAFYDDLKNKLAECGKDIETLMSENRLVEIAEFLLENEGLGYGKLPKALLKFHKYKESSRLALEEHLVEATQYSTIYTEDGEIAQLHFTVSQEHLDIFKKTVEELIPVYEREYGIRYDISYSVQKPSTDTIAVDMNNEPFRNNDGSLLFRPGGHGALIQNLTDLKKEVIFIKNIDNVVPDRLKSTTYDYKKVLGGYLFRLQQQQFEYLNLLDEGCLANDEIDEIAKFAKEKLMIDIPNFYKTYNEIEKIDFLYSKMNRPMRICGMVKNEGEPGGGPYWTRNSSDEVSLQIVESSQIDHKNEKQEAVFQSATHFNPVDLVCATYDFRGEPFDLNDYIDYNTGFISQKSKDGKELKALELPGLWNGAMADWINIFVEVPIITFNPVKTVNDLLRDKHQEN